MTRPLRDYELREREENVNKIEAKLLPFPERERATDDLLAAEVEHCGLAEIGDEEAAIGVDGDAVDHPVARGPELPVLGTPVGADADGAPIGLIASAPALLLAHPSVTYRGVGELIADMRASKEPFQVGTPGVSTVNHLAALLFAEQAKVKLQTIPYKGSQPLNTDLIGGHVKIGFNPIPVSRTSIEGRLIRALAATSMKRSSIYPDLPTISEQGLPGFDAVLTYGLVAAAGTPRPIVDKLNRVLRAALAHLPAAKAAAVAAAASGLGREAAYARAVELAAARR